MSLAFLEHGLSRKSHPSLFYVTHAKLMIFLHEKIVTQIVKFYLTDCFREIFLRDFWVKWPKLAQIEVFKGLQIKMHGTYLICLIGVTVT